MKINIEYLMKLGAIKLSDEEKEKFEKQLENIIDFVGQLQNIKTDEKPLYHSVEKYQDIREGIETFNDKDLILKNVKHQIKDGYIVIKDFIS